MRASALAGTRYWRAYSSIAARALSTETSRAPATYPIAWSSATRALSMANVCCARRSVQWNGLDRAEAALGRGGGELGPAVAGIVQVSGGDVRL